MKRILVIFLMALIAQEVEAGYGRGGSSGGRSFSSSSRSSYSRSYSAPSYNRSYVSPGRSYQSTSHTTVVNHGSSSGGFGSHIGAGLLGYMMGSAGNHNQAPVVVNGQPMQASYVPPVGQPAAEIYPGYESMPSQQMGIFGIIFWTLFLCFAVTVVIYIVKKRSHHCEH